MTSDQHAKQSAPVRRTPAKRKARQLAKHLRPERPDYTYLKEVFRHLRDELGVEVTTTPAKLPYVLALGTVSEHPDAEAVDRARHGRAGHPCAD